MRALVAALLLLSALAACDQLNKPMAVPNGNITMGGTSASSSGGPDAGSDALPALPGANPHVAPQPGDTQL